MVMKPGAKRGNYPVKGVQPLGWGKNELQRDTREILKEDTRKLLDEYYKRDESDIGVEDNTQLCEG